MYLEGNLFKKNTIFSTGVIGDNVLCSELRAGRTGFLTLGVKFHMLP
jgi:hypothetical protein